MTGDVATKGSAKRSALKFNVSHTPAMRLTTLVHPVVAESGWVKFVPRPQADPGKPCRMLDGNQGAPVGFGVYVGKTKVTCEAMRRGPQGVRPIWRT